MSQSTRSHESVGGGGAVRPATVARSLLDLPTEFRWHEPVPNEAVTGITLDSRQVMSGDLYCALAGANVHGADYADQAIGAGAAVILTDQIGAARVRSTWPDFPLLVADNPRAMVGELASWVYGYPSESMKIIGITGTDGKTTTAMLAEAGLQAAGFSTGLIGTIATRIGNEEMPSVRTTPEAPELQALLAVMLERGVTAVVMEVSSHALALGRVSGIRFDLAIFTNLGHDHLDFHKSQEEYFSVKARLFTSEFSQAALVCVDDTWGKRLASTAEIPTQTYSVAMDGDGHTAESTPDWSVSGLTIESVGWRFVVAGPTGSAPGGCQLPGLFNVRNALAAIAAVSGVGASLELACRGVASCQGVPGRMQAIAAQTGVAVLVDYAHTPDAVTRALGVGRELAQHRGGRVVALVGCGGDRDAAKRPMMGESAARMADVVIITDDNPRSEDPQTIRQEMMTGVQRVPESERAQVLEIAGREKALQELVRLALPADVALALGKGHETTQEINGQRFDLDDRVVLAAAVAGGRE